MHLLLGLGGIGSVGKLNVTESTTIISTWPAEKELLENLPLGTTSLTVGDDTAADNLAKALKLTTEPVLVNVPAHVANEQVLDALFSDGLDSLGLLDRGLGDFLSLALLGGSLGFIAVRFGRGVGVRVGIGVRVRGVVRGGGGLV